MKILCLLLTFFNISHFCQTLKAQSIERPQKILILGDSITYGYGVDKKKAYPAIIEKKLNSVKTQKFTVYNAGVSGDTTAGGLRRLKWLLKGNYSIIIIALGGNDGLRGLSLEMSQQNLRQMIKMAQESRLKVLLAGMQIPPNYGKKYTQKFQQIYVNLSQELKIPVIPFLLVGVGGESKYNISDGIHPNEKGHQIVAKTVMKYLEPLL